MSENDFKVAPIKPEITLADLEKIDIRVGTIVAVEEVADSDQLMKLTVDFGDRQRTILSGIKQEREKPAEIAGKQAELKREAAERRAQRAQDGGSKRKSPAAPVPRKPASPGSSNSG